MLTLLGMSASQSVHHSFRVEIPGGSEDYANQFAAMLKSRPEIAEATAKIETSKVWSSGYLTGGSPSVIAHIVVVLTPISIYAGKKGVDFLLQYIKDHLQVTKATNEPVRIYGADDKTVLVEFIPKLENRYSRIRWRRWKWGWWNAFWWWRAKWKARLLDRR